MYYSTLNTEQSIVSLANSFLQYYNCPIHNNTLLEADFVLRAQPRNIVFFLFDGLGYNILKEHLSENSFLLQHTKTTLSSVFPTTTTAAATALESGLFPSQSGWLGWSVYWKELDANVNLYANTLENGQLADKIHLGKSFLKFTSLVEAIHEKKIKTASFNIEGPSLNNHVIDYIIANSFAKGRHFTYVYCNEPDNLLHKKGCHAKEISKYLEILDQEIENMCKKSKDTLFFFTADHGFIDIENKYLDDYPLLKSTLSKSPSIEPRALNFFIKPTKEKDFISAFYDVVENSYILYSKDEILEKQLFGAKPYHTRFLSMLGDYIGIAQSSFTLFPHTNYKHMRASHGGLSATELTVPLIIAFS